MLYAFIVRDVIFLAFLDKWTVQNESYFSIKTRELNYWDERIQKINDFSFITLVQIGLPSEQRSKTLLWHSQAILRTA